MAKNKTFERKLFFALSFILFIVITLSVFQLFRLSENSVDLIFSYVAGISMIVLPCTLPLVFIVVPLSMGKGYKKGLGIAVLFGLGLSITLAIYGIFIALIGNIIGLDEAVSQAGLVSRILFMVGGVASLLFGLSELKLIKFELPSYASTPEFIEKRKDYAKAFFLGLFLGNAGVGCPNPLFYILLGDIAIKGNILFGGLMGFIHGIGRATPLIFLSILGIIGINATSPLIEHREKVKNIIGWSLIVLGAIIFVTGGAHEWYEKTFIHNGWNRFVNATGLPAEFEMEIDEHENAPGDIIPTVVAPWLLLALVIAPTLWYYIKRRKEVKTNG
ncbi:MAG: cytochrome c biogenesis CcdA family protein [Nitrosopumilaceae archaeon]